MREITEAEKSHFVDSSFDRMVSRSFPSYMKFFTKQFEFRKMRVVNIPGSQEIEKIEEIKQGGLGDVIEVYTELLIDRYRDMTFIGWLRRFFSRATLTGGSNAMDRDYLIAQLRRALNAQNVTW
jgi:hypothetical protein